MGKPKFVQQKLNANGKAFDLVEQEFVTNIPATEKFQDSITEEYIDILNALGETGHEVKYSDRFIGIMEPIDENGNFFKSEEVDGLFLSPDSGVPAELLLGAVEMIKEVIELGTAAIENGDFDPSSVSSTVDFAFDKVKGASFPKGKEYLKLLEEHKIGELMTERKSNRMKVNMMNRLVGEALS